MNTPTPHSSYPFLPSPRSYLTLPSPPPLPSSILSPSIPTSLSAPAFQSHRLLIGSQPYHHEYPFSSLHGPNLPSPPLVSAAPSATREEEEQEQDDDSLLLRTAGVLALSTLEQKGHSWLAARKSSTSLSLSLPTSPSNSRGGYFPPTDHTSDALSQRFPSAVNTPRASRSRHHSRRSSASKSSLNPYPAADFVLREPLRQYGPGYDLKDGRHNNAITAAAENEVRRLLTARVSGWLEWAVGWMDFRDDDDDDDDNDENDDDADNDNAPSSTESVHYNKEDQALKGLTDGNYDTVETTNRSPNDKNPRIQKTRKTKTNTPNSLSPQNGLLDRVDILDVGIPPPPPPLIGTGKGNWDRVQDVWWGDAKWLFVVARRVAL